MPCRCCKEKIKKLWPAILPIAGSFVISAGWNYYHIRHVPVWRFVVISMAVWLAAAACFFVFKKLFVYFSKKFSRHIFWQEEFVHYLDELCPNVSHKRVHFECKRVNCPDCMKQIHEELGQ